MPKDIPWDVAQLAERYQTVLRVARADQQVWVTPHFWKYWHFYTAIGDRENTIASCTYQHAQEITENPALYLPSVQDLDAAQTDEDLLTLFYASPTTEALLSSIESFPWLHHTEVEGMILLGLRKWRAAWQARHPATEPTVTIRRAQIRITPQGVYAQEVPA
jgi:hypothetical protein